MLSDFLPLPVITRLQQIRQFYAVQSAEEAYSLLSNVTMTFSENSKGYLQVDLTYPAPLSRGNFAKEIKVRLFFFFALQAKPPHICECGQTYCQHVETAFNLLLDNSFVDKILRENSEANASKLIEPKYDPAAVLRQELADLVSKLKSSLILPLDSSTRSFLKSALKLRQKKRGKVWEYELRDDFRMRFTGVWVEINTKPAGPELTPWQYVCYLIWHFESSSVVVPEPLSRIFDYSERLACIGHLVREQEVTHWKEKLAKSQGSGPATDSNLGARLKEVGKIACYVDKEGLRICRYAEEKLTWKAAPTRARKLLSEMALHNQYQGHLSNSVRILLLLFPKHRLGAHLDLDVLPWNQVSQVLFLEILKRQAQTGEEMILAANWKPLVLAEEKARWHADRVTTEISNLGKIADYIFEIQDPTGKPISKDILGVVEEGEKRLLVTSKQAWFLEGSGELLGNLPGPWRVPAEAVETKSGLQIFSQRKLPLHAELESRAKIVPGKIHLRMMLGRPHGIESLQVCARCLFGNYFPVLQFVGRPKWEEIPTQTLRKAPDNQLLMQDIEALGTTTDWLCEFDWQRAPAADYNVFCELNPRIPLPEILSDWFARKPAGVEVEVTPELNFILNGQVAGHYSLDFEESSSGMDWFDVRLKLEVADVTLTEEEIQMLQAAPGRWVRLPEKGWRKLSVSLNAAQEEALAELGFSYSQVNGPAQKLHALHLTGKAATQLLPAERAEAISRRVEEIRLDVVPELPKTITASLRPYQTDGLKFLAFLTENNFGGILADDMGLGKTLQTLAWLAWLQKKHPSKHPSLVVCPKSVCDNWLGESARFFPTLKVMLATSGMEGNFTMPNGKKPDLVIMNYAALRNLEAVQSQPWNAIVLDEAQNIKNPSSQTAQIACRLNGVRRLALSGTPIENRLMDLWSIMAFAMPGALGTRANFGKTFDSKADPLARKRLSQRIRPFLLRRTKKEVASDLPDRTEEDLSCELEGTQAKLYQAELKRARAMLLKAEVSGNFDAQRFSILTSLLRLRQICCHPELVGLSSPEEATPEAKPVAKKAAKQAVKKAPKITDMDENGDPIDTLDEPTRETPSAKLNALMELLSPLMQEGHKVLVFSQFTTMLDLIRSELDFRNWKSHLLTGKSENRGELVENFQNQEGAAVFLISLKAGGSGLNLTAASYVVLFDPWWNPAVEAQAIDRTHRIGQTQKVIAYRLVTKNSVEEKIRALQKQKGDLANDILGEESFAQALSIKDFRFLLGEED